MVWCGVVWCGVVWFVMVLCGLESFRAVVCGFVWFGIVWCACFRPLVRFVLSVMLHPLSLRRPRVRFACHAAAAPTFLSPPRPCSVPIVPLQGGLSSPSLLSTFEYDKAAVDVSGRLPRHPAPPYRMHTCASSHVHTCACTCTCGRNPERTRAPARPLSRYSRSARLWWVCGWARRVREAAAAAFLSPTPSLPPCLPPTLFSRTVCVLSRRCWA
jgi:hypothetical protein